MQNAILANTPSFDFQAFVAWSAGDRHRAAGGLLRYPDQIEWQPAERQTTAEPERNAASTRWIVQLHLAAARRWLVADRPQRTAVEASLRCIGEACADYYPVVAETVFGQLKRADVHHDLSGLLDDIGRMVLSDAR